MIETKKDLLEDKVKLSFYSNATKENVKEVELLYKDIKNLPKLDGKNLTNKFVQSFVIPDHYFIFFTITTLNEKDAYFGEENILGPYKL